MTEPPIDKDKRIAELESEVSLKELRKSRVRIIVTYLAASFLFVGGPILIAFFVWTQDRPNALTLFNTILPVSAAIISYWFAGRSNKPK